jgi:hypothetical protein
MGCGTNPAMRGIFPSQKHFTPNCSPLPELVELKEMLRFLFAHPTAGEISLYLLQCRRPHRIRKKPLLSHKHGFY